MPLWIQLLVSDMPKDYLQITCAKTTDMCGTYHTTVGFTLKIKKNPSSCVLLFKEDQGNLLITPTTGS